MVATETVAVGLGEVLWDLFPSGKQLGGAPANFAYHAQQLGAAGVVVSAVGRDPLGRELLERLRAVRLDVSHVAADEAHPTGTVTVTLDAAGVPSYIIDSPVAWDFIPPQAAQSLAPRASVVCFGSLAQRSPASRASIRAFLRAAPDSCLRVFDINLRQHFFDATIVRESLEMADVLKLNDQELPIVADLLGLPADERRAADELVARFDLRAVALTRGDKGSSLFSGSEANHHRGYRPATLVDTVGAGDAFTAVVAIGLLKGHSLDRINDAANRLASYVCTQEGAMPLAPDSIIAGMWGQS